MTVPVTAQTAVRPGPLQRMAALAAVGAARLLARRPPTQLRRVMTMVARGACPATYAEASLAQDTVLTVSVRCRGPRACLLRSIAAALLCRLRGTWPTWCVGVIATPPFTAHAWVQVEGAPVDERFGADSLRTLFSVDPST